MKFHYALLDGRGLVCCVSANSIVRAVPHLGSVAKDQESMAFSVSSVSWQVPLIVLVDPAKRRLGRIGVLGDEAQILL